MKDLAGSATLDMVKDKISHFAENSRVLVGVLDEVGKAHPFILSMSLLWSEYPMLSSANVCSVVAVAAFKAAITLELNRRENDQKVITLNVAMCDMMEVMALSVKIFSPITVRSHTCSLKNVVNSDQGADGVTIEQRLRGRMLGIADSIKQCAKLCDSYQKRSIAGRCWFH